MGVVGVLSSRKFLGFGAFFTTFLFLIFSQPKSESVTTIQQKSAENLLIFRQKGLENEDIIKWLKLRISNTKNLSRLGEILFLNESEPNEIERNVPPNQRFQILIWKYGKTIENRHLKHFSGAYVDPFEHCPVKNCDITDSNNAINEADIVIFHLHRMKGKAELPKRSSPEQIWAFLTDESPYNTFLQAKNNKLPDYNGVFNWSMTYRADADIPVPYGRTILKSNPEPYVDIKIDKRRDVLVAIMGSNCGGVNNRWKYVKELQKHIKVNVYGACGPLKDCPGHFTADCPAVSKYLFYLSFENSNCDEYITEKLWWNAIYKNSIPIVMGAPKESYEKLLPPGSYIHVDDYASPAALAQNLLRLNETEDFRKYYRWKANFEVLNEHGFFKSRSYHYCRICQALNYNSRSPKTYDNLEEFWSVKKNCYPAWDTWQE